MIDWLEQGTWYAQRYTDPMEPWMGVWGFVPRYLRRDLDGNLFYPPAPPPKWHDEVLAWPTLERLAHARDRRRVDALRYWRDITQPAATLIGMVGDDETNTEGGLEVRPTEQELLRAVGWTVTGKERWHYTGKLVATYDKTTCAAKVTRWPVWGKRYLRGEIVFGELRCRGSELVEWGKTSIGRALAPVERPARGKSSTPTARPMSKIRQYLCLDRDPELPRGAVPIPGETTGLERVPCSKAGAGAVSVIDKTAASAEAERILAKAIVNTEVMPAVTRYPPYVLPGKQWVGGIHRGRNDAPGAETGPWDAKSNAEREMARTAEESRLRSALGEISVILDEACTNTSAAMVAMTVSEDTMRTLGLRKKYTESSAEKYGTKIIDRALDKLITVAEIPHNYVADNDNVKKEEKVAA